MSISKIQISGFGYIDNVVLIENEMMISVHFASHGNPKEDIWLHCSASTTICDYIKNELLTEVKNGAAVLIKFQAYYEKLLEVFSAPDDSYDHIVIYKANLETIESVYINGALKSPENKQKKIV